MALKSRSLHRSWLALSLAAITLAATGCAASGRWIMGGWVADYETAEQRVQATGKDLLIYFKPSDKRRTDRVERMLNDDRLTEALSGFVRCKLFRPYEPHRRYLEQFGVRRAPALVAVRSDGTYHATTSVFNEEDVDAFLAQCQQPGAVAVTDPLIPRKAVYQWHRTIAEAREAAAAAGQPILYVFARPFTGDWRTATRLLDRREVFIRTERMAACRLSAWSKQARVLAASMGIERWPAMAVCAGDEPCAILCEPETSEQICRLVDGCARPDVQAGPMLEPGPPSGQ